MSAEFGVFQEIAAVLALAAVGGGAAILLRQPLIVGYIAVGILAGPAVLGWVTARDQVDLFARLGITLLLFVVGLKLDVHVIRTVGPVALATGLGQVLFTSAIGYLLALGLGLEPIPALYVAVALTFSSTIIIVKLLSDKREVDSLHGRIAIGFLIVQDIVVVLVMVALTAFAAGGQGDRLGYEALAVVMRGAVLLGCVLLLMRYVLPRLLRQLARSPELLVLSAIGWAVTLAAVSDRLGFSKEVGAFLAGVSLASTVYREAIAARLVSLRDFLLLFFFIDLGAQLELGLLGAELTAALVLSLFVLIGNPLIVMVIMGAMGYRKRTGFLAGLTVAQISEFSLILAALGLRLGHLTPEILGLVTLVGLITISASTYMIVYSHPLYERLAPWLGIFERRLAVREEIRASSSDGAADVVLFGLGRFGASVAENLRARGFRVLAVDFDPALVRAYGQESFLVRYGDAEDPEFLAGIGLDQVSWVVSTIRDVRINRGLLMAVQQQEFGGRVALAAHGERDAALLKRAGADLVLIPYADAARETVDRIVAHPAGADAEAPAGRQAETG